MARGDQIYVYRPLLNLEGVYEHHGIDCGDGSVIHYRKSGEAEVARTSFGIFAGNQKLYRKAYPTAFVPDAVVHRATSRLGERRYNLLFNNCEHFATWCKTGVSHSEQVRDFLPIVSEIDPSRLGSPIAEALEKTDRPDSPQLLQDALSQIKGLWNERQPQYNQAVSDRQAWDRVAREAVRRERDDLARGAIARKLAAEKEAKRLKAELDRLATMTETLIRNGQQAGIPLNRS